MASVLAPYRDGTFLEATQSSVYFIDAGGAPSGGTFVAGDIAIITPVFNGTAPTTASPFGYRCTTGGTPGTWVAIGGVTLATGAADALTAHAGGGQASALALTAKVNRVSTVATAGDSVALPASTPGLVVTVINDTATPMQVYGVTPDTINDVATGTGVTLPANSTAYFACPVAGKWYSTGGAGAGVPQFVSVPLTLAQLQALVTGVQVIPAQGAGTLVEVTSAVLNLAFGSANFAGTGIAQLSYGNATTYLASATIAASVFTTFAASQNVLVAGALAVNASTNVLNKAIWFNANANYTSGTGATATLDVSYKVHTGLS